MVVPKPEECLKNSARRAGDVTRRRPHLSTRRRASRPGSALAAGGPAGYSPRMSSATLVPTGAMAARSRLMTTLLAAQVCGSTANTLTLAMGSIVAADLTGDNTLSGIPVAVGALG